MATRQLDMFPVTKPYQRRMVPFLRLAERAGQSPYGLAAYNHFAETGERQNYHAAARPWRSSNLKIAGVKEFTVGVELELEAVNGEVMRSISKEARYYALLPESDGTLSDARGVELTSRPYAAEFFISLKRNRFYEFVEKVVKGNLHPVMTSPSRTDQGFHVNVSWAGWAQARNLDDYTDAVAEEMRQYPSAKRAVLFGRANPYGYLFRALTHLELKAHRSTDNPLLLREYVLTTLAVVKFLKKILTRQAGDGATRGLSTGDQTKLRVILDKRYEAIRSKFYPDTPAEPAARQNRQRRRAADVAVGNTPTVTRFDYMVSGENIFSDQQCDDPTCTVCRR